MADAPVIAISTIKARARDAFYSGQPRTAHNMNWHASALVHWLAEYDRVAASIKHSPSVRARVDAAQGMAS